MPARLGAMHPPAVPARSRYLAVLAWSFALFNAARLVAYLPTVWAIWSSGQSQQHSLFTWLIWTGANLTMAMWLYEQDGRQFTRSVAVNACNAVMCLATSALIVALRAS
jgi:hypothetical protein